MKVKEILETAPSGAVSSGSFSSTVARGSSNYTPRKRKRKRKHPGLSKVIVRRIG